MRVVGDIRDWTDHILTECEALVEDVIRDLAEEGQVPTVPDVPGAPEEDPEDSEEDSEEDPSASRESINTFTEILEKAQRIETVRVQVRNFHTKRRRVSSGVQGSAQSDRNMPPAKSSRGAGGGRFSSASRRGAQREGAQRGGSQRGGAQRGGQNGRGQDRGFSQGG
nr:uncharacterized protein LOC113705759 [Coffea arabica]